MQKKNKINQIEPYIDKFDKSELTKYINSGGWITEHSQNKIFEEQFKKLTKSKYSISFPNGTLTLLGILLSINVKKNDEIIVPTYTMVATPNAVLLSGAKVVFCDISKDNLCMCPESLKKKINKRTKAIIYVTLNGRSGHIDKIKYICEKNKISLIEDSAHSIGSFFKKKHHGNFGTAGSFSFSMPKIITTGQGGMVVTNNFKIFEKLKKLKNFGRITDGNDLYDTTGYNFKFTDLQATLGISQLKSIKWKIKKKGDIFKYYFNNFSNNLNIEMFAFKKNETPWFTDIYVEDPKKLKDYLKKKNIITRLVYPSLDSLKIFKSKGNFRNSNYFCSRGLWLPSSLNLSKSQISYISKCINDFFI